ncbi:hypothetical protein QR680_018277 [Steinernema hermaphroditum]|uniref:Secreted protein n=1 Tax=Steinernema hermaphroditum TaxID=289476 RepID=A0AA39HHG4_9BILA|nr:hypothetical protein QR680_018277 [Steinernema hermaphroditum]
MIRLSPLLLALFWILDVADGLVVLSGDTCSSPELRAAIEKSLKEDVAQTLVALREELMTNIKPAHFVIFCVVPLLHPQRRQDHLSRVRVE